jgi:hypothetical protein
MNKFAKPKRVTANGYVVQRACEVAAITAFPGASDLIIKLRDGGAAGTIKWEFEADSSTSSATQSFPFPLYFGTDLYVDMAGGDANKSVSVALVEGTSATDI